MTWFAAQLIVKQEDSKYETYTHTRSIFSFPVTHHPKKATSMAWRSKKQNDNEKERGLVFGGVLERVCFVAVKMSLFFISCHQYAKYLTVTSQNFISFSLSLSLSQPNVPSVYVCVQSKETTSLFLLDCMNLRERMCECVCHANFMKFSIVIHIHHCHYHHLHY